ncbi:FxsA family protein [Actinoplanes utahensis]|uniref:Exlusion protein FxsA n=1 Tax=Actinoplanes utahensis TaxID=1869 RepID=A0A0A6X9Y0_ACTUT|nr:FxsA family protein [Actinoplanes utahensis]KHD76902.1 exlusion protein FxsA [Actinoplanes utahensis]GIF27348.1 membrane protein [Actinoplanes utahensis]
MRRSRLAYLPIAFPLLALAEFAVFVSVAHAIGFGFALLALALCSIAGIALLRREGIRGWHAFQEAARAGRPPGAEVSNSLIGLGGALLLALPGFVTGVAGLLLLLPPGRVLARRGVERLAERSLGGAATGDLFGPRRVRVHQDAPVTVVVVDEQQPRPPAAAIEGEIIR